MSDPLPIEVDCPSIAAKLKAGDDFLLLDCRQPDEFETARINGAVLIPMGELSDRIGELERYRQRLIVVHCHHGGRSLRVTHWLRNQGFDQVQNMTGGIDAWSQLVDESVPRY